MYPKNLNVIRMLSKEQTLNIFFNLFILPQMFSLI